MQLIFHIGMLVLFAAYVVAYTSLEEAHMEYLERVDPRPPVCARYKGSTGEYYFDFAVYRHHRFMDSQLYEEVPLQSCCFCCAFLYDYGPKRKHHCQKQPSTRPVTSVSCCDTYFNNKLGVRDRPKAKRDIKIFEEYSRRGGLDTNPVTSRQNERSATNSPGPFGLHSLDVSVPLNQDRPSEGGKKRCGKGGKTNNEGDFTLSINVSESDGRSDKEKEKKAAIFNPEKRTPGCGSAKKVEGAPTAPKRANTAPANSYAARSYSNPPPPRPNTQNPTPMPSSRTPSLPPRPNTLNSAQGSRTMPQGNRPLTRSQSLPPSSGQASFGPRRPYP